MHMSFLVLRSRRCLVEISRIIDRYRICRFFPSYSSSVQLADYLSSVGLLPVHQSAYRKFHSTEIALLKVVTDLIETIDAEDHAFLGLLDLSAEFDTVDHDVLVECLARTYGLRSTALDWLRSYLLDRRQSVFLRRSFIIGSSSRLRGPAGFGVGAAAISALHGRRW